MFLFWRNTRGFAKGEPFEGGVRGQNPLPKKKDSCPTFRWHKYMPAITALCCFEERSCFLRQQKIMIQGFHREVLGRLSSDRRRSFWSSSSVAVGQQRVRDHCSCTTTIFLPRHALRACPGRTEKGWGCGREGWSTPSWRQGVIGSPPLDGIASKPPFTINILNLQALESIAQKMESSICSLAGVFKLGIQR